MIKSLRIYPYTTERVVGGQQVVDVFLRLENSSFAKSNPANYAEITTGLRLKPGQWGGGENWLLGTDEITLFQNQQIRDMIDGMQEIYFKLKNRTGKEPGCPEVKRVYKEGWKEKERIRLLDYIPTYIVDAKLQGGTLRVYEKALPKALSAFMQKIYGHTDVYLDEIDQSFLYQFELYMSKAKTIYNRPYEASSIKKYIEKVQAMLTLASKVGLADKQTSAGYELGTIVDEKEIPDVTTYKEAIRWKIAPEELLKIESTPIAANHMKDENTASQNQYKWDLTRTRLIFLFQTWTGFAHADLQKYRNVRELIQLDLRGEKSIIYNRAKNGELGLVPLFEQTEKILEALDYNISPLSSYDTYKRRINALLNYYNIDKVKNITHLGRHLFGSRLLNLGFSMEAVSRCMGHTSITETEKVYAPIDMTKVQSDYMKLKNSRENLGQAIAV